MVRARVPTPVTPAPLERHADEAAIAAVVSKGGSPAVTPGEDKSMILKEVKFTLRLSGDLKSRLEADVKSRPGKVSLNTLLIELAEAHLARSRTP